MSDKNHDDHDYASELAVIEERMTTLANPSQAVQAIWDELDRLYRDGADETPLRTIQSNAVDLMTTAQELDQAFRSAVELARTIQRQRDIINGQRSELKRAVEECDTDVPEIMELYESLEEDLMDNVFWEVFHEETITNIVDGTGFSWADAARLNDLLFFDLFLPAGHPIWDDLKAWMGRAEAASKAAREARQKKAIS